MTEDQNVETLTAKTPEPAPPAASPRKDRGWVKVLIWVLAICLALCVGAVVGGGVVCRQASGCPRSGGARRSRRSSRSICLRPRP
jgi:hypothetical protein